jgi:hypothetical protein
MRDITQARGLVQGRFSLSLEQKQFLRERLPHAREVGHLTVLKLQGRGKRFALVLIPLQEDTVEHVIVRAPSTTSESDLSCVTGMDTQLAGSLPAEGKPPSRRASFHGELRVWHPKGTRGPFGYIWVRRDDGEADDRYTVQASSLARDVQEKLAHLEANWHGTPDKIICRIVVEFSCGVGRCLAHGVRLASTFSDGADDNFAGSVAFLR